jgi:hypothetical protein
MSVFFKAKMTIIGRCRNNGDYSQEGLPKYEVEIFNQPFISARNPSL